MSKWCCDQQFSHPPKISTPCPFCTFLCNNWQVWHTIFPYICQRFLWNFASLLNSGRIDLWTCLFVNNIHEKITWYWLAESSAVQVILGLRVHSPFAQHQELQPIHGLHIPLHMLRVKVWLAENTKQLLCGHAQKIGPSQRSQFLVLTEKGAASEEENEFKGNTSVNNTL